MMRGLGVCGTAFRGKNRDHGALMSTVPLLILILAVAGLAATARQKARTRPGWKPLLTGIAVTLTVCVVLYLVFVLLMVWSSKRGSF